MSASKSRLKIVVLRKKAGLTQKRLAEKLGVTVDTIANWERGRVTLWHIEIFVKLCEIFECSHKELVEFEKCELVPELDLKEMRTILGTSSHVKSSVDNTKGVE